MTRGCCAKAWPYKSYSEINYSFKHRLFFSWTLMNETDIEQQIN